MAAFREVAALGLRPAMTDAIPFTRQQIEAAVAANPTRAEPLLQQWVMAQYGAAMLQVQAFELQLASLVLTVRARDRPPSGNIKRQLERSLKGVTHLLERATASEMRRELEGRVSTEVLDEIDYLIPWRNRLAHRYLRQRAIDVKAGKLKATPEMVYELFDLANAFTAAGALVQQEQTRIFAEMRKPSEVPPGLVEAITLVMVELMSARGPTFTAKAPSESKSP